MSTPIYVMGEAPPCKHCKIPIDGMSMGSGRKKYKKFCSVRCKDLFKLREKTNEPPR